MEHKPEEHNDKTAENNETAGISPQADLIPILPIRGMVAYPQMSVPFMVSLKSTPVIEKAMTADKTVGLLTVKHPETENPVPGQLYEVGTIGKILHTKQNEDGMLVALVRGLNRFRLTSWHTGDTYLSASVDHAPEIVESGLEMEALQRELRSMTKDVLSITPNIAKEAVEAIDQITDPLQSSTWPFAGSSANATPATLAQLTTSPWA